MPASKRMVRGGGDLPRNPSNLKKKPVDAADLLQMPSQLELVPEAQAAPVPASEGIVVTIKSVKLKESTGKRREGKPPVYRSVTGKDAGGKTYYMAIEMDDANPQKGEVWVVEGRERKHFGKPEDPIYPIDVTSFKVFEEVSSECAKVSSTSADALVDMEAMLQKYNIQGVLQALTDSLKFLNK